MSGLPAIATVELTSRFGSFVPRSTLTRTMPPRPARAPLFMAASCYGGIVVRIGTGASSPRKICSGVVVEHIRPEQSGQDQFLRSPLL